MAEIARTESQAAGKTFVVQEKGGKDVASETREGIQVYLRVDHRG